MPATFIPDTKRGPGNGLIIVKPITCKSAPTFALYRSSDKLCLSHEGWQNSEVFLKPRTWNCHENALLLAVDNSVVNYLDKLNTYKIVIQEGDASQGFTLSIEDIIQATLDGGQGVGMGACTAIPLQMTNSEQDTPVMPTAAQEEPKPPMQRPQPPRPPQPPEANGGGLDKITMPTAQPPQSNATGKKKLGTLLMLFLVLALLGAAFWWFMEHGKNIPISQQNKENSTIDTPKIEKKADDGKGTQQPRKETDTQKQSDTQKQAPSESGSSAMNKARTLLRKNEDGAASKALADSLREVAQKDVLAQDAVFLLLEDAAQKGEITAMRELGAYYDPTVNEGKGSITPDMNEAHAWYDKALAGGDTKAIAALNRLHIWVKKAAEDGDVIASQLLRRW